MKVILPMWEGISIDLKEKDEERQDDREKRKLRIYLKLCLELRKRHKI